MVLPDSDGIPRVPPYSGYSQVFYRFRIRDFYSLWFNFPVNSSINSSTTAESYNPTKQALWFGLFPFRSPLLRESRLLSLPTATQMFQFTVSSSFKLCIHLKVRYSKYRGFPHSEILGSLLTYSSPGHIVVSHVLRRLLVPRHPPCALNYLTFQLRVFKRLLRQLRILCCS